MIITFKDKETELIWEQKRSKKMPTDIQNIALRKLFILHWSKDLRDLSTPPSNRPEKLKGNKDGLYSIRINDQWRICFVWRGADAFDVEIIDYH